MTDVIHRTDDELLSVAEAAAIVRAPVATLRYWRHLGTGPHSFKVGRSVRYWRSDVIAWLEEQST
jgi:predicted DNA-binding transcriptional regulator AlpA